ncbi:MAG TPA: alkaline phosphatase family protein [bacterium]|nr:alkaline phosphatase family protein [bacterium]
MIYKRKPVVFIIFIFILLSVSANFGRVKTNDIPYVILISFDGFRWDYPQRGLTPNLELMAQNGVSALSLKPVFPTKTFPNHYSIITGLYPVNHGIIFNDFFDKFQQKRYKVGDVESIRNAQWYWGEAFWETAERQGIKTGSYFWPGSELKLDYRRPTFFEFYDHDRPYPERIETVLKWLSLPAARRPHFVTLYFDATDTYGHRHGPNSPETDQAIRRLDNILGKLFDGLKQIGIEHQTNVIVVSDHGMSEVSDQRLINIDRLISDFKFKTQGDGPVMMLNCGEDEIDAIYQILQRQQKHFRVYLREQVPEYYHFSAHPYISPLVLIADPGWSLVRGISSNLNYRFLTKGNHGYDNHHLDMHGIFYALGPAFKNGYRTGTLLNIDIYPLICAIFNIIPRQNIDGKLARIGFILKQ